MSMNTAPMDRRVLRGRWRSRVRWAVRGAAAAGVLIALSGGCAAPDLDAGTDPLEAPATTSQILSDLTAVQALGLVVRGGDTELVLRPHSYCWFGGGETGCADGMPADPLPVLALDDASGFSVEFSLDWEIQASLLFDGEYCNGLMLVDLPRSTSVETLGPAGRYRVAVFGWGAEGDAAWTFELVTSEASEPPPLYAAVNWHPSSRPLEDDTRFSIGVGNLQQPPASVSGAVVVTASDGAAQEFPLSVQDDEGCWASNVGFGAPEGFTGEVLDLGPAPYEVTIFVVVDDMVIESDPVRWPDDFPADSNQSGRVDVTVGEGSP